MQCNAVAALHGQIQTAEQRRGRTVILQAVIAQCQQRLLMMCQRRHLQRGRMLQILQKPFLLLDFTADASFDLPDAALHLFGLAANKCACGNAAVMLFDRVEADLGALAFLSPVRRALCRLPQLADLLAVLFIFRLCKLILPRFILLPA